MELNQSCECGTHPLATYRRTVVIAIITLVVQTILVYLSGSLALLSDTIHLVSDTSFLFGSFIVVSMAAKMNHEKGDWVRGRTAYVGITMLAIGAYVIDQEATEKLLRPQSVASGWVLLGGIVGALGNYLMLRELHPGGVNIRTLPRATAKALKDLFVYVPKARFIRVISGAHAHDSVVDVHVLIDFGFSLVVIISATASIAFGANNIDAVFADKISFFMTLLAGFLFCKTVYGVGHSH